MREKFSSQHLLFIISINVGVKGMNSRKKEGKRQILCVYVNIYKNENN